MVGEHTRNEEKMKAQREELHELLVACIHIRDVATYSTLGDDLPCKEVMRLLET